MTETNNEFIEENLMKAFGIVSDYLSQKSEDIPDWDEISGAEDPYRIRVFITDKSVQLPPACAPVISALLVDAGIKSIAVVYEHAEPIELY